MIEIKGGSNCTWGQNPHRVEIMIRFFIEHPEFKDKKYLYDFHHEYLSGNKGFAMVYGEKMLPVKNDEGKEVPTLTTVEIGKVDYKVETRDEYSKEFHMNWEVLKKVVSVEFVKTKEKPKKETEDENENEMSG